MRRAASLTNNAPRGTGTHHATDPAAESHQPRQPRRQGRRQAGLRPQLPRPQGKAVPATAANLAEFETRRAEYEAKAESQRAEASERLSKLEGASVTIYANASTEGKLYGSVGPRDIADALTKAGVPVEKSEVVMGEGAFRAVGEYEVIVHLHADVETTVKVVVQPDA